MGFLFQDPERQIFHSTVRDEVLFSLRDTPLSREERERRLSAALEEAGLSGREGCHPLDLNSAERRMVALASLGIREPELLLLDEPTRELDAGWLARFGLWLANRRAADKPRPRVRRPHLPPRLAAAGRAGGGGDPIKNGVVGSQTTVCSERGRLLRPLFSSRVLASVFLTQSS